MLLLILHVVAFQVNRAQQMAPVLSGQECAKAITEATKSVRHVLSINLGSWCPKPLYNVGNRNRINIIHKS